MTLCRTCNSPGQVQRLQRCECPHTGHLTWSLVFICNSCSFTYRNFDGLPARGRPRWAVPLPAMGDADLVVRAYAFTAGMPTRERAQVLPRLIPWLVALAIAGLVAAGVRVWEGEERVIVDEMGVWER